MSLSIKCDVPLLRKAIDTVNRAVAKNTSIPQAEGILVSADESGVVTLTGYNLRMALVVGIPAEVETAGGIVIPSKLFTDIVKKAPDDVMVIKADGTTVIIDCGEAGYKIGGFADYDYPKLPVLKDDGFVFSIGKKELGGMIEGILHAVLKDDTRPNLQGANVEISSDKITMVAIDGFRLAIRRGEVSDVEGDATTDFIIPAETLPEAKRICNDGNNNEDTVKVSVDDNFICFETESGKLISRRIDGKFSDYSGYIPENQPIHFTVDKKELAEAVSRVSVLTDLQENKVPLVVEVKDGILGLSVKTAVGESSDSVKINGDGGGLRIGFNSRYFLEGIQSCPCEAIEVSMESELKPTIITPPGGEPQNFLELVLPVRLKS